MFCCCSSKSKPRPDRGSAHNEPSPQVRVASPHGVLDPGSPQGGLEPGPHLDPQTANAGRQEAGSGELGQSRQGLDPRYPISDMLMPAHVNIAFDSPLLENPMSVNRESCINKAPSHVEIESKVIIGQGLITAERIADYTLNRYNEEAMIEEFTNNINSPGRSSNVNLPLRGKIEHENPLLRKGNMPLNPGLSESKVKDRRKKAIKNKLSAIKSLFCKEIISDIIYDNKEKEISKTTSIPRCLFILRGKSIMKHLFSFLGTSEKVDLLLAIKFKVIANKDSNLLFLCLVKAALAFEMPKLVRSVQWNDLASTSIKDLAKSNLDDVVFLRYVSLFIDFPMIQVEPTYNSCLANPVCKIGEIDKDIPRTFPDFFHSDHRRQVLKDVLIVISTSAPSIGYVQGINAITGAIMIYFEKHTMTGCIDSNPIALQHLSFTLVKFMLERRSLSLMYERSLYGFSLLCLEIRLWVKVLHPALYQYLVRLVNQGR